MLNRNFLTALAAAAISLPALVAPAMVTPAAAEVDLSITIGTPPPAPRLEVIPAPRAGYVWAPGYWHWDGYHHVWMAGRWMAERPGYHWQPDHWVQSNGGWRHVPGYWDRQQAHAWADHHPDNPYRR
jgi:WXXGXW repeat (2 copies)